MTLAIQLALGLAAAIHLLPIVGVLGQHRLRGLYGLDVVPPDVELLLRHRSVLFAGLGVALLVPLWAPELTLVIGAGGLVSAVSFLVLSRTARPLHPSMKRVVVADIIAIACLTFALAMTVATG